MIRPKFNRIHALQSLIVLLMFSVLVSIGGLVWFKHQQYLASLSDLEPRYARLLGLVEHRTELQALDKAIDDMLTRLAYPASQDSAQAGNDAQQRIRSLFADSQLDISSIQVLPAKEEGAFNRITINLHVEGNLSSIQTALERLGSLAPMVVVDSMSLQTIGAVRPASVQRLGAQFNLSVFRLRK